VTSFVSSCLYTAQLKALKHPSCSKIFPSPFLFLTFTPGEIGNFKSDALIKIGTWQTYRMEQRISLTLTAAKVNSTASH
jgi:hypothetical protein